MIPTITLPNAIVSALPVSPSSIVSTSEATLGRLPVTHIVSPVAVSKTNNNSQGNAPARIKLAEENVSSTTLFSIPPRVEASTPGFGFSSPFLAQLIAQSGSNKQGAFLSIFSEQSAGLPPIIDFETFVEFSEEKYKPSNAGLPVPKPFFAAIANAETQEQNVDASKILTGAAAEDSVAQPASESASIEQTSQIISYSKKYEGEDIHPTTSKSAISKLDRALTVAQGVDIYFAALSRNDVSSDNALPQVSVTL